MPPANKLCLVGIGYRPLAARAHAVVMDAVVLLASSRLLDVFRRYDEFGTVKDRIKVIDKVPDTISFIREWFSRPSARPLVLLASGDPLFFGIGRRMIEEFGREGVEILPDLSSIQMAFARINLPWDDAFFISLHGGPDIAKRRKLPYEIKDIPWLLERYGKLGILTDKDNNPSVIAAVIARSEASKQYQAPGIALPSTRNDGAAMIVCERLGYPDEKISSGTLDEMEGRTFTDPNVVILQKPGAGSQGPANQKSDIRFGLREDDVLHERGLITKDEVRAVTLHKLRLPHTGVFWDIGAGSGSVSLEAGRLCPGLTIYAVEKDEARAGMVRENATRLGARNISIISGPAPDALVGLPAPDCVFIGGSDGNLDDIVGLVSEKMPSGVIVINAAALETLHEALTGLERNGFSVEVSEISVSRSKLVAGRRLMSALNPVFIITGEKG